MRSAPFRTAPALLVAGVLAALAPASSAQASGWADGFAHPGSTLSPSELAVFDAGTGPRLYVASLDQYQSPTSYVLRRHDGNAWDDFHVEVNGRVLASAVWDDGSGPALYLAGEFTLVDGVAASRIVRFDGTTFTPLGAGISGTVTGLAVHDDGNGPALFAVGVISAAGGVPVNGVARWNGSAWGGVASIPGLPKDLVSFDDGGGPALFVAGDFLGPGATSPNVARWDGVAWSFLPLLQTGSATAITVHDDGTGPALYAANQASSSLTQVVRWTGAFWTTVGPSFDGAVLDLESTAVGGGSLVALGEFTTIGASSIRVAARWNGAAWSALDPNLSGSSCNPTAFALASFQPAGGPAFVALGGCFYGSAAGAKYGPFAWDGARLASLPAGHGLNSSAVALCQYDDGSGPALYAGGGFQLAGHLGVQHVARWTGAAWAAVGAGLSSSVTALAPHDDGSGAQLYAGTTSGVRRWDGSAWTQPGTGLGAGFLVFDLASFDPGTGARLYAAYETFDFVLNQYVDRVAVWDGATWTDVGGLFDGPVLALAVHDDGTGPALYAGGAFEQHAGSPVAHVARLSAGSWIAVGAGTSGAVWSLLSHDDGTGLGLIAGGAFASAGGTPAASIARWRGGAWSPLGAGLASTVHALHAYDDGTGGGALLVAGGSFTASTAGGTANRVASWNGAAWAPLGEGVRGGGADVDCLATLPSAWGPTARLAVGGFFSRAGEGVSANFALWGPREDGVALCFGDGVPAACPCGNTSAVGAGAGCRNSTGQGAALRASGEASVASDTLALHGSGMTNASFVTYFQGTAHTAFGFGVPFDDGLRCAGGAVLRLGTVQNVAGTSGFPNATFPQPVSVRGLVPALGGTRVYQARYRDVLGPCGTFANLSNSVLVTWRP